MTNEEWEKNLKRLNEEAKKWVVEEIDKIKYNVVKEIIQRETKNDYQPTPTKPWCDYVC